MPYARKKRRKQAGPIFCILVILVCLSVLCALLIETLYPGTLLPRDTPASSDGVSSSGTTLSLDRSELTLYVSTSAVLTVSPEGAAVSWESDHPEIASVENGTVRALAPGSACISAVGPDGSASCTVTVLPLPEVEVTNPTGAAIDKAALQSLRDLTAQNPLSVSVYYRDLTTGTEIEFNSLRRYSAGSVVKAPYCKWLFASGADLNEVLTKQETDNREGAGGSVAELPAGSEVTVRELIRAALRESDNVAYAMLAGRFGFDGFLDYAQSLGVGADQSASNLFGTMSPAGAGLYFADFYQWSVSSPEESREFLDDLCNTTYRMLISSVTDVPVAHKYGWNGGNNGFHDAALVFSDHPYVLAIFTTLNADADGTVSYIQQIAACLNTINTAS